MPSKSTVRKARRDLSEGKSPTTAAGEFVHEEIEHIRHGTHGARSTKQAIAIGLSKARGAGVALKPPPRGRVSESTRKSAERAYAVGQGKAKPRKTSASRSRAVQIAIRREPRGTVSTRALSRQAKQAAARRRHAPASSR